MKIGKAREIESALDRPSPDIRLYLIHGPDGSAAAALAARLGKAMGGGAERIDIDGSALKGDPARLADEAAALSLFGERRYVRVSGAGEESLEALSLLLAVEQAGNPVIALAPTVRSTARIVKLACDSRRAMAYACYEPTAADAAKIAATLAQDAGLRPTGHSARRLAAAAGGDRAVMAREVEKLALFLDAAPERPRELDDEALDAVGADLGEAEIGRLIAAVIDGDPGALGAELARQNEAGTSPIPWLRALTRRLVALAEMRGELDRGGAQDAVFRKHRVFFKEEAATAQALRHWSAPMLTSAIRHVRHAERNVMATGNAGAVLADHQALDLARRLERRR